MKLLVASADGLCNYSTWLTFAGHKKDDFDAELISEKQVIRVRMIFFLYGSLCVLVTLL